MPVSDAAAGRRVLAAVVLVLGVALAGCSGKPGAGGGADAGVGGSVGSPPPSGVAGSSTGPGPSAGAPSTGTSMPAAIASTQRPGAATPAAHGSGAQPAATTAGAHTASGVGGGATPHPTVSLPNVPLVVSFIPYGPARRDEMAAYSLRHYGVASWVLQPRMIVLHLTADDSPNRVIEYFADNAPQRGELPGVCAHFLVAQDGAVHQLVPTAVRCRHVIGLNDQAIGIEVVQAVPGGDSAAAERAVLARTAQVHSLVALVKALQQQFSIPTARVYGHAMANSVSGFHDLEGWRNDHTDWGAASVTAFRRLL